MKYNFPLVHMNGNDGQTLADQYQNAMEACSHLRDALSKIQFHPRDYYPLGMEHFDAASTQREEILQKLNDIDGYLLEHAIHIYSQIESKKTA